MTLAQIVVWFALRKVVGAHRDIILRDLGDVQHELDCLVNLGLLSYWHMHYSLNDHPRYQIRRDAKNGRYA